MNTRTRLAALAAVFTFLTGNLPAQVPQLINYQGRVAVAGVNFDGTGSFKFALVNPLGVLLWSNDGTGGVNTEPAAAVSLPVSKGLYSVLLGDTTLANMTAIPASAFQSGGVRLRVWFNDGTHGSQLLSPDQRIDEAGYAMMAGTVANGAITSAKFASGAVGATQMAAGAVGATQLASGGVTSANLAAGAVSATHLGAGAAAANLNASGLGAVPSGGVVLGPASAVANLQSLGYVNLGQLLLGPTWERSATRARYDHTAVWTGSEMVVWGGLSEGGPTGSKLLNDGARYNPAINVWTPVATAAAPAARYDHTAVWTGSEMVVWGGNGTGGGYSVLSTGGRYNPATNAWTPTSPVFAPEARHGHTAVWTGSRMIVWGGYNGTDYLGAGRRYDPATDVWHAMNIVTDPPDRAFHTAVWTGSEMIVWGGRDDTNFLADGARYNPTTNVWGSMASVGGVAFARASHTAVWTGSEMLVWGGDKDFNILQTRTCLHYNPAADSWVQTVSDTPPSARSNHTAVWTGSEMIIWGGGYPFNGTGGRYNPTNFTWTAVTTAGAPAAREAPAIWTGSEMIVWGGVGNSVGLTSVHDDGGRYHPASNTWTALPGSPTARTNHTAVWTGSEMLVWGGTDDFNGAHLNTGGRYNPAANTWSQISTVSAPFARQQHSAVWTGSEMLVWGGTQQNGGRYFPGFNIWLPMSTIGQPSARRSHTAVWTGSEMIVWGGHDTGTNFNTGGRYNPTTDGWTATGTTGAPGARSSHTAVWTGSEMIVWGGSGAGTPWGDGGRYNPAGNTWTAVTTTGAPAARSGNTAVWTGSEMIVWGGYDSSGELNTGGRYSPAANTWIATSLTGAPLGRYDHTAVWTGSEMIVWGGYVSSFGYIGSFYLGSGGRYIPTSDTWTRIGTTGGPAGREGHTAVWTGREMIVWGGYGKDNRFFNDTFSYFPGANLFFFLSP